MSTTQNEPMSVADVTLALLSVKQASEPGKVEDGTRVHIQYEAFRPATPAAILEAQRAEALGLPSDRYTGRISRIWKSGGGDLILTVFVELERNGKYRAMNLTKGKLIKFVVLGN